MKLLDVQEFSSLPVATRAGRGGTKGRKPSELLTAVRALKPSQYKPIDISDEIGKTTKNEKGEDIVVDFNRVANRIQSSLSQRGAVPFKVHIDREPDKNLVKVYRPADGGDWALDEKGEFRTRKTGKSERRLTKTEWDEMQAATAPAETDSD